MRKLLFALIFLFVLPLIGGVSVAAVLDNGDGTLIDTETGLMWPTSKIQNEIVTWEKALALAEGLTLGGYSDWRLPSRNELQTLLNHARIHPACIHNFGIEAFWTSTTCAGSPGYAWTVGFLYGQINSVGKNHSRDVLAVRGNQDKLLKDTDSDGIVDGKEDANFNGSLDDGETDPNNPDTDADGLSDGIEDANCNGVVDEGETSPLDSDHDGDGIPDGTEDADRDGEVDAGETDPCNVDTDGDGLSDGVEDANHNGVVDDGETSPLDDDYDDDGIPDGTEDANHDGQLDEGETDPRNADTNGDGIADGLTENIVIADSVKEFSEIQGTDNWYYGYYVDPFDSSTFVLLDNYLSGQEIWAVAEAPAEPFYTWVSANGGYPNRQYDDDNLVEHWTVRRWISEISGKINISGLIAKTDTSGGDGIVGYIYVDGSQVLSVEVDFDDKTGKNYDVYVDVDKGSVVDFVISPGSNDSYDSTTFTTIIKVVSFDNVVEEGLLVYYPLDLNANDKSGNGNNGVVDGAVLTKDRFGSSYHGYYFDSLNDSIACDSEGAVNNFSYSFWVYTSQPHEIDQQANSGTAGVNGQQYFIFPGFGGFPEGDSGAGVSIGINGVSVYEHAGGYMPPLLVWEGVLEGWNHIAVVYKNKRPELYINGICRKIGLQSPMNNVHGTCSKVGGGYYGFLDGALDEFRFYNRTLNVLEIKEIYQHEYVELNPYYDGNSDDSDGLLIHYTFDGDAVDKSGHGNDGLVEGAELSEDRFGRQNKAYYLDSCDDSITSDLVESIDAFSIAFWAKTTVEHEIDPESNTGTDGVSNQNYFIFSSDGIPAEDSVVDISIGTNGVSVYEHAGWYMPPLLVWEGEVEGWNHIAVVYKNKTPELYVNGVFKKRGLQSPRNFVHGKGCCIGGGYHGFLDGYIDEYRFYNRPLSDLEIKQICNSGQPGDVNGNNTVGLEDAILVMKILVSEGNLPEISMHGDMDDDNRIGMTDALPILQKVAGIRND